VRLLLQRAEDPSSAPAPRKRRAPRPAVHPPVAGRSRHRP
jgi:hypothetical protein